MDKKNKTQLYVVQRTHLKYKNMERLKVKGGERYVMLTLIKRKLVGLLISEKENSEQEKVSGIKGVIT